MVKQLEQSVQPFEQTPIGMILEQNSHCVNSIYAAFLYLIKTFGGVSALLCA